MVGSVGAAGYLIVQLALRMLDFMSVEIIFGFEIAQDDRFIQTMCLSISINFVQTLIQYLKFFFLHLYERSDAQISSLCGQTADGMMQVISERFIDIAGEAGFVDAFFLVDD